jgi:acyl-CoA synthetase (AMP-forming)/AMP-acid ligase II
VAVAYVVPRPGARAEPWDVRRFCRERLQLYKVPDRVEIVPAIPRNSSGKPLRAELAARARAGTPPGGAP